jgi:hypothetical protein
MSDNVAQGIVRKLYGTNGPDLTPEMTRAAEAVAKKALAATWDLEEWTEKFATGDESVDRPLYREYKHAILSALISLAEGKAQELRG